MCVIVITTAIEVVNITENGNATAGADYTLNCAVKVAEDLIKYLRVVWTNSSGDTITGDWDITEGDPWSHGNLTVFSLTFNPLRALRGGEYTCQASFVNQSYSVEQSVNVTVTSEQHNIIAICLHNRVTEHFQIR